MLFDIAIKQSSGGITGYFNATLFHLEDIFLTKAIIEKEKESLILVDMFNTHYSRMYIRRI